MKSGSVVVIGWAATLHKTVGGVLGYIHKISGKERPPKWSPQVLLTLITNCQEWSLAC